MDIGSAAGIGNLAVLSKLLNQSNPVSVDDLGEALGRAAFHGQLASMGAILCNAQARRGLITGQTYLSVALAAAACGHQPEAIRVLLRDEEVKDAILQSDAKGQSRSGVGMALWHAVKSGKQNISLECVRALLEPLELSKEIVLRRHHKGFLIPGLEHRGEDYIRNLLAIEGMDTIMQDAAGTYKDPLAIKIMGMHRGGGAWTKRVEQESTAVLRS